MALALTTSIASAQTSDDPFGWTPPGGSGATDGPTLPGARGPGGGGGNSFDPDDPFGWSPPGGGGGGDGLEDYGGGGIGDGGGEGYGNTSDRPLFGNGLLARIIRTVMNLLRGGFLGGKLVGPPAQFCRATSLFGGQGGCQQAPNVDGPWNGGNPFGGSAPRPDGGGIFDPGGNGIAPPVPPRGGGGS